MIGAAFGAGWPRPSAVTRRPLLLFRDVQPALLRYLQVVAPAAADDVAGETWLQVVAALPAFSGGEEAFRGWLSPLPGTGRSMRARSRAAAARSRSRTANR